MKIKITYLETRERKVRLGIVAPQNVTVHREEIQEKIDNEREKR